MNNIGYKVKKLRKGLNMTQKMVSSDFLSRSTLSKIETSAMMPSVIQMEYLAQKFNVPITELFEDGVESPSSEQYNMESLEELYYSNGYFEIIEKTKPIDFNTYYYVGMSYYKLNLKDDAEKYLKRCESLFENLADDKKASYVERLCIALNSMRRCRIKSFNSKFNKKCLDRILYYLQLYKGYNCEIYYIVNNNIANYYLINSMHHETIELIEKLIDKNKSMTSITILPSLHLNLSIAYFSIGNYDKAINSIKKSIMFYRYLDRFYEADEVYINLFNCYLYKGDFTECEKIIKDILDNNISFKLINRFENLKLILMYNEFDINGILKNATRINIKKLESKARIDYYYILGRVNFIKDKYKHAVTYYKMCINYLKNNERYTDLYLLYNDMYVISGNKEDLELYQKYMELSKNKEFISIHPDITSPECRFGIKNGDEII